MYSAVNILIASKIFFEIQQHIYNQAVRRTHPSFSTLDEHLSKIDFYRVSRKTSVFFPIYFTLRILRDNIPSSLASGWLLARDLLSYLSWQAPSVFSLSTVGRLGSKDRKVFRSLDF